MRLSWASLPTASPGQWVELEGWLAPLAESPSPGYGLLVPQVQLFVQKGVLRVVSTTASVPV